MKSFLGKRLIGTPTASQSSIEKSQKYSAADRVQSGIAKVLVVYSERNSCDIETWSGAKKYNVPVRTKGGLIGDEVYGELDLPAVGDFVIVSFLRGKEGMPLIEGTIFPFLNPKFFSAQVPVNSASKAFTKKLLEKGKSKTERKICKSGTTIEVQEDGSVVVETPSGSFIHIKESDGKIIITSDGNMIELNGNTKDFVTHAELDTALQSFINALNLHVHPTAATGPPSAPTTPMSLDISGAKATKVKTG